MKVLFDGKFHTHYGQGYLILGDTCDMDQDWRKGQINGLLGAGFPTFLFLVFGLHTGDVRLTVRLWDAPPEVEEAWEEVVEASFRIPPGQVVWLCEFGDNHGTLDLDPGVYRVRYCAHNFGAAEDAIARDEHTGDEMLESYQLDFWKAEAKPDAILRQTSPRAAYWHSVVPGRS